MLIHSACGGIGIAAINVCRMVGAKIYATVGTQEKVDYLANTFNIPRERIFGSRDSGFLPGLMRETGGKGVDVALNSLSGDLLHATVSHSAQPVSSYRLVTDAVSSGNALQNSAAWSRLGNVTLSVKADFRWTGSSQIVPSSA